MSINKWPSYERPREKLLEHGAKRLSNAELLAILLRSGTPGRTALDLARELLSRYQGLRQLFHADKRSISRSAGIGNAKFCQMQAALELSRRYLKEAMTNQGVIRDVADTQQFFIAQLRHYEQEVFAGLFLDNQHQILQFEILFQGSISSATVHPRELVKRALQINAAAVIVAHNHPSGISKPSQADRLITKRLVQALALIEVKLLDHIVVGDNQASSLASLDGWQFLQK